MARTIYAPGTSGIGTKARALAQVGRSFSPGWCLYWCLTEVFKVPGLGDYDHDGDPDAEDYWKAAVARGKVVKTSDPKKLPPGSLGMWTGGSHDNGHAAYILPATQMVSTDLPTRGKIGKVPISMAHDRWGLTLVGAVLVDGNGFTLIKPKSTPPPAPKLDVYEVIAKTGLNGRKYPNPRSSVVHALPKGAKIEALRVVESMGTRFVVGVDKCYYDATWLRLVK